MNLPFRLDRTYRLLLPLRLCLEPFPISFPKSASQIQMNYLQSLRAVMPSPRKKMLCLNCLPIPSRHFLEQTLPPHATGVKQA